MRTIDILSYAFSAIKLRKFRTGLTALGIVIGIAAIVAFLSLGQGFQNSITRQFETGFSTNTLTIYTQSFGTQTSSDLKLYVNDTIIINDITNVQASASIISKSCYVKIGDRLISTTVLGVDFKEYSKIYSSTFIAEKGEIPQYPTNETIIVRKRVNDPWKNGTLFGNINDPIQIIWTTRSGFTLVNKSYTGRITAILEEIGGISISGPSDMTVYIPLSQAQSFFNTNEANTLIVQLANSDEATINSVTKAIKGALGNQVQVVSPTAILDVISTAFTTIELFLAGIAGISLLVAGIGIMNIMIVSLMERTREIGILKALGMKNRTVLTIFLCESLIIGLIGTVIGIAFGLGVATAFSRIGFSGGMTSGNTVATGRMSITPVLTPTVFIGSLAFGTLVSVIFAVYPAWRASKLKPVDALRYE